MPKYLHLSDFFCTFAVSKVNEQQNLRIMFGVKCSNQPITGQFAEEFVRNLLEARKQPKQDVKKMSHVIVCE